MKTFLLSVSTVLLITNTSLFAMGLTPSRLEIGLKPGEVFEGTYTVTNDQGFELPVSIASKNWFTSKDNLGITATDWLKVTPEEIILSTGASETVHYKITVPEKANGMIMSMVSFVSPSALDSNVNMALTVPIYVTVQGTEKVKWQISEAKPDFSSDTTRILAYVENKGNVHVRPSGNVKIYNKNRTISIQLNFKDGAPVYPGRTQEFYADDKELKLVPGRYTAEIEMQYKGGIQRKKIHFTI
jgi:hypothetical protein